MPFIVYSYQIHPEHLMASAGAPSRLDQHFHTITETIPSLPFNCNYRAKPFLETELWLSVLSLGVCEAVRFLTLHGQLEHLQEQNQMV